MARQTKMIIITSNDDVIRQLSSNKSINTHIIDLGNTNQTTTTSEQNNNIINLAFLAELSELNSKNDQVYKRALNSSDDNNSQRVKLSKKTTDSICAVCDGRAIGFNYNVLSCASCKAFFHRNANQPPEKLKCNGNESQGQCSIAPGTRRRCLRCRLDRCFAAGMRKDFMFTDEEKQRREKLNTPLNGLSISESTNLSNSESLAETLDEIDRLMMDMNRDTDNILLHEEGIDLNEMDDVPLGTLSVKDWITIESIRSSFLSSFQYDHPPYFFLDVSDHATALISWSQIANQIALRLINFFRQIDEFENLHADDRFLLIKYNLIAVFPISRCLYYNQPNNFTSYDNNEDAERFRRFVTLCGGPNDIGEIARNLVVLIIQAAEQDPIVLSLLLTILIFSRGLSMNANEPFLTDSLAVNRAQSYYTTLLWKYLISKEGEVQACRHFTHLLTTIFRIQSSMKRGRDFLYDQFMITDTVDRMAPLMQTVLHIS